jgi:hypothetical protein
VDPDIIKRTFEIKKISGTTPMDRLSSSKLLRSIGIMIFGTTQKHDVLTELNLSLSNLGDILVHF